MEVICARCSKMVDAADLVLPDPNVRGDGYCIPCALALLLTRRQR